jgi:hypothetical protein
MEKDNLDQLLTVALKHIKAEWRNRSSLEQFEKIAKAQIQHIRGEYMRQVIKKNAVTVIEKLVEAGNKLQLPITAEIDHTYFRGYFGRKLNICHQDAWTGVEIFFGPQDVWDRIIVFIPKHRFDCSPNPYTKKRLRSWKSIPEYDFDSLMMVVKELIENPPPDPFFEDDGEDEHPF